MSRDTVSTGTNTEVKETGVRGAGTITAERVGVRVKGMDVDIAMSVTEFY
jgi:hypothetical protein